VAFLVGAWGGRISNSLPGFSLNIYNCFVLFFVTVSIAGLLVFFVRRRTTLSVGALSMACIPILIISSPKQYVYQYVKALVSVAPITVVGYAYFVTTIAGTIRSANVTRAVFAWSLLIAAFVSTIGTVSYTITVLEAQKRFDDPRFIAARRLLETTSGRDFLIDVENFDLASWLAYAGRRNNLWFKHDFYTLADWGGAYAGKKMKFLDLNSIDNANVETITIK
jgi:hypothetical protein